MSAFENLQHSPLGTRNLIFETHVPPIIRIARASHADLISVINHRHTIDREKERFGQFDAGVLSRHIDQRGCAPADFFLFFSLSDQAGRRPRKP